jgi:hypothetical protein
MLGGALSALFGGGQSGESRKGLRFMNEAGQVGRNTYSRLLDAFRANEEMGAYDAQAAYAQAIAEAQRALNLQTSGALTRLRGLGYKPGDSILQTEPQRLSEDAQIGLSRTLLDLSNQKQRMRQQDLNDLTAVGLQSAGLLGNLGGQLYGVGRQREQANAQGLGSLMSIASLFKK